MNILLIILLINLINAQLNLYLDSVSVEQLFELKEHRLYFINENRIRQSAFESSLSVSANIHFVEFTWNEDRFDIDKSKLYYEYNTSSSDEQSLLRPVLNIIEKGIVPKEISTFSILFPCLTTNRINCSVLFRLYNSTTNHTTMIINLKFLKYCRIETTINQSVLSQFYNSNQIMDYLLIKESRHRDFTSITITTIFTYSLIIAFVVFLIVFCTAISLFCLYRLTTTNKTISNDLSHDNQDHPALPMSFDMTTFEDVSLYSCTQYDFTKTTDELLSSVTFADCTIDQNRVTLHEIIMEGRFGRLLHCSLNDSSTNISTQNIYGKTVNSSATSTQLNQMLHDCCLFATLKHSTINSPLGIIYKNELSPYPLIIYPYSNKGILKRFIIQNRTSPREQLLSTQELVYMAIHIAKGLHFLHRRKMLMKDIGTRNCLVMDDLTVKLTDYALSRDLFPQDYDCLPMDVPNESRPLKFMAIESINDRRFSTASDVWSYGVLLWELMSRGLQPYADIESCNLVTHLQDNYRLVQPINCPDSLFKLMSACWIISIDQRPSMTSLLQLLMEFYGQLARFI
ncbi:unnamed protein product [Rotaria sordida]|uniref:Protein kinase domain-containing protein n=2 Tax=Rotaria sordida TaxID=392033 RepID=A0A813PK75_9BILA|nr:unnamed protein product [Rotaria sordida]